MRWLSLFRKTMIENFRDWKILILILTFAPFFVLLMYFYIGYTTETYKVIFVNHDQGVKAAGRDLFNAGQVLISEMTEATYEDGTNILVVYKEGEMAKALKRLEDKSVDVVVEIPNNFSETLMDYKEGKRPAPVVVKTYGDPANTKYIMAAAWCDSIAYHYAAALTGQESPLELQTESISRSKSLNDFSLYVPALLALAVMMLMFTAAATIIREKDKGTIIRLRISNMTTFEWLSAVSVTQIIIGLLAIGMTYLTAISLGYRSSGSLIAVLVVGILSSLSIIAISLVVAALIRSVFDLMTIGCFPFFILMFFSGGMFPIPPLQLFVVGDRSMHINDILPTTHSISALGKILNYDSGLGDVVFEIGAIVILSFIYFAAGVWLFTKRHMRAA
jgi:ABC-2 type transport system permease protein